MSQFSNRQPQNEYEWSEPRPPIPGKESRRPKVSPHFMKNESHSLYIMTDIDD